MESVLCVFSPGNLANTSAGAGYVGLGAAFSLFDVRA